MSARRQNVQGRNGSHQNSRGPPREYGRERECGPRDGPRDGYGEGGQSSDGHGMGIRVGMEPEPGPQECGHTSRGAPLNPRARAFAPRANRPSDETETVEQRGEGAQASCPGESNPRERIESWREGINGQRHPRPYNTHHRGHTYGAAAAAAGPAGPDHRGHMYGAAAAAAGPAGPGYYQEWDGESLLGRLPYECPPTEEPTVRGNDTMSVASCATHRGLPSGPGPGMPLMRPSGRFNNDTEFYKTRLCTNWMARGTCNYGPKCLFAHGEDELRQMERYFPKPKKGDAFALAGPRIYLYDRDEHPYNEYGEEYVE